MRSRSFRLAPLTSCALLLVLTAAACARMPDQSDVSSEPDSINAEPMPVPHAPSAPTLTTFREGDGASANLAFRSDDGVALSDEAPLVLVIEGDTLVAPLTAGPARFTEPEGAVVDQASYRLDAEAFRALVNARPEAVTVRVSNGKAYHAYPYLSGDLIE